MKPAAPSLSDDEEDIALSFIRSTFDVNPKNTSSCYHNDELQQYSMETCTICQAIFHTKYDHYMHLASHLVIKIEPTKLLSQIFSCRKCDIHLVTAESLKHHNCIPIVPIKLPCKKLIVKCENLIDLVKKKEDLEKSKNIVDVAKKNESIEEVKKSMVVDLVEKNDNIEVDNGGVVDKSSEKSVSELIKSRMKIIDVRNDILNSFVCRSPIVKCDNSLAELIKINNIDKSYKISNNRKENEINNASIDYDDLIEIKRIDTHTIHNTPPSKSFTKKDKRKDKTIKNDHFDNTSNSCNDIVEIKAINEKVESKSSNKTDNGMIKNKCTGNKLKRKYNDNPEVLNDVIVIEDIVENEPVVQCEDKIASLIKGKKNKSVKENTVSNAVRSTVTETSNINEIVPNGTVCSSDTIKNKDCDDLFQCDTTNLKCRLVFEDDSEDEINNLDFDEEFDKDLIDLNLIETDKSEDMALGKIIIGSKEETYKSIHYDDLQRPGVYRCRYCSKSFPNKYLLVRHEVRHVTIRQRRPLACHICDRYIAGNHYSVRQHVKRCHPSQVDVVRKTCPNICPKCGLKYYHYSKHSSHYHYIYRCKACGRKFETEDERKDHEELQQCEQIYNSSPRSIENSEDKLKSVDISNKNVEQDTRYVNRKDAVVEYEELRTRKLCEVCFMFLKNTQYIKYLYVDDYSEIGKNQVCEMCCKSLFEVKLVRTLKRKVSRKIYEANAGKSREEQLKNIQNRLKRLKKLTMI